MVRSSPLTPPVMRRRLRIFEAAVKLFSERGFEAVGVREIAEKAGVSKSLINRHFHSKEGLRAAVDADVLERFQSLLETILGTDGAADTQVVAKNRAKRMTESRSELLPLLNYLRHSLLENSEAGHTMFKSYLANVARYLKMDVPSTWTGKNEPKLWLSLATMFMQLGPILLEKHIEAVTGRSPFHPDAIKSRSLVYGLIESKLREIRKEIG